MPYYVDKTVNQEGRNLFEQQVAALQHIADEQAKDFRDDLETAITFLKGAEKEFKQICDNLGELLPRKLAAPTTPEEGRPGPKKR